MTEFGMTKISFEILEVKRLLSCYVDKNYLFLNIDAGIKNINLPDNRNTDKYNAKRDTLNRFISIII